MVEVAPESRIAEDHDLVAGERPVEEISGETGPRADRGLPRPVGVREPENRERNPALSGEAAAEVLGGFLVDRMDIRRGDGVIFPHRQAPRGTVQLAGAGEDDPRRRRALRRRRQQAKRPDHISLEVRQRTLHALPMAGDGGEVEDHPGALESFPERGRIGECPAPEGEVVGTRASRKPIEADDLRAESRQRPREAAADETAGSGNDCPASGEGRFQMGRGHRPHCPRKGALAARLPSCGVDERTGAGTLFVVATPIGNLEDLSPRAVAVLRAARWIACENSRAARRLKTRFGFPGRLVACHDHNEGRRAQSLVRRLEAGEDVALISDAGTPLLSDPGYRIVRAARLANLPVRAIPGPSAIPAALSVAGLPTDVFSFFGFPPARRGAKRRNFLLRAAAAPGSLVFFESAVRAARLLEELDTILGEREASLSREVTKIYEDHWFGSLSELRARAERAPPRGEVTLVVGPKRRRPAPA